MRCLKYVVISIFFIFCNTAFAAFELKAGPIWNGQDAQAKCPSVCARKKSMWNGQWRTTVQGQMSVCQCEQKSFEVQTGGPVWNGKDAQSKCPNICARKNSTWTGRWRVTVPGQMAVCGCAN